MKCGSTFLLCDDDDPGSPPHLHIVITNPDASGCVVLVSITTRRARSDAMTCLEVGDHPFIKQPSVITYAYSKLLPCAYIENLVLAADAMMKEDAPDRLVQRAQAGMTETDRAPQEVKEFFLDWWAKRHNSN